MSEVIYHASPKEAQVQFKSQVQDMLLAHPVWMAAVWGIDKDGKLHVVRTTCSFPQNRVTEALLLLDQNLMQEAMQRNADPLPRAEGFQSIGQVLGESQT